MTSTPVKGSGSLQGLFTKPVKKGTMQGQNADGFADLMNQVGKQNSGQPEKSETLTMTKKLGSLDRSSQIQKENPIEESDQKTTDTKDLKNDDLSDAEDVKDKLMDAGEKLVQEVAKELDVSEDDVKNAMEVLGLTVLDLFSDSNLTQLAITVSGEDQISALLTNEDLYSSVQNLMETLDMVQNTLSQELQMDQGEIQNFVTDLTEQMILADESGMQEVGTEENVLNVTQEVLQETVSEDDQKMLQSAKPVETEITKVPEDLDQQTIAGEKELSQQKTTSENSFSDQQKESDAEEGQSSHEAKQIFDTNASLQNVTQKADSFVSEVLQNAEVPEGTSTKEIMDQILDYVKVQIKPEMDQLEMQLHPASLGNVKVQLVNRGGEITAQFQVQNEAVKSAIESQLTVLKEALQEQGVKIEAVEVTVGSHAFESNLFEGQGRDQNRSFEQKKKAPRRIQVDGLNDEIMEEMNAEDALAAEMLLANGGTVDYTA